METTEDGEFVMFIKGTQHRFIYCNLTTGSPEHKCLERSFPEAMAATHMVKFSNGLYIIGYAKDSIYATMDFT